jgi:hypothetical protein
LTRSRSLVARDPMRCPSLFFWHCCDFINHESRESIEAVAFVGNRNAKQRRFGWISGNDADCDGLGGIEAIILQNGRRPRLAGVILCPRRPSIFHCVDKILVPSRIWTLCHDQRLTMGSDPKRRSARVGYPNLDRPQPSRAQPLTMGTDLLAGRQTLCSRPRSKIALASCAVTTMLPT